MTTDLFSTVDETVKEKVDKAFSPLMGNGSIGVYIDGANLFHTTKLLNFRVDFLKIRELISHYAHIRALNYFSAENDTKAANDLTGFLSVNGYNVHVKNAVTKPIYEGKKLITAQKKNIDVDMAVYAVDNAATDSSLSQFILFTGDGDFIPAVRILRRRGPVTVISSNKTKPSLMCRQLREECDHFIDLKDLQEMITYIP